MPAQIIHHKPAPGDNLVAIGADRARVLRACEAPCVLVADELPPSVAAQLDWTKIQAFVTDAGSRTYHTAILARSLHVPAVVGLHDATERILPGTFVVVDGADRDHTSGIPRAVLHDRRVG